MQSEIPKPSIPTPLFRQIVNALKRQITDGDLSEHSPLPSERLIAETHGVSRMTARRALEAIEAEGLAYSKDRKGRFVSPKRLDYNVSSMENFFAGAARRGIEIEMKLLDSKHSLADEPQAKALSVPVGTEIFENTRLYLRQGHATFLETETVIVTRCAEFLTDTSPKTTEYMQKQRYSALGHTADIVIRMCAIDPAEAEHLGLMPYQAGIEQEQFVRDRSGVVFCHCHQIWRGEIAQFSARAMLNT